ncbi:putative cytochrome P450 6a13 [Oratosquilla oratoria]|uniref:putative cytochrome P450 6a13 n=1 Tax=Oratosquilla oratoria TaxID=337810 RepID=UPI003F76EC96
MLPSLLNWLCAPLLYLGLVLCTLLLLYLQQAYRHWERQGVPGPKPIWILGNIYPRLRPTLSMAEFDQMLYTKYGGKKYCGFYEFTKPVLMVGDLEMLKHIMVKDFDHFTDRSFFTFNEPVMDHMLLGLKGSVWKAVRSVMTPTFSSGKIKQTMALVKECSKNLVNYFDKELTGRSSFEMKEVYGMFTMDTIASIAFGVNSDSLNNAEDEFSAAAARFFEAPSKWKRPFFFFQLVQPHLAKLLRLNIVDRTPIHFFSKVVSETIQFRMEKGIRRNDFLQLLLDARMQEYVNNNKPGKEDKSTFNSSPKKFSGEVLNELVITAQCVLFYIAGYDTTATTLSFVSYCLALNPKVQQRVMDEIETVLDQHGGEITYEAIQEMTYLDMVFAETLRLYPPAPRVDRECTKEYTIPGTNVVIHKDQKIIIPIYSIHHDPEFYPDPKKFNPDRFLPENKVHRPMQAYMPFGSGPRNCIGMRFALMEAKVAMVYILQELAFIPSKKTQVPIVIEKRSGLLKAEDGIWVRVAKRCEE